MSSLNPPEARPTFATHVLNATQAMHYLSGQAVLVATVPIFAALGILPLASLTIGCCWGTGIIGAAGIAALKSAFTFVATKWALGTAGIVGLFYLTHLPLFGRYLSTVSKIKTMIEEKTEKQLEVNYARLVTRLFGLQYLIKCMHGPFGVLRGTDLLSYKDIQFQSFDRNLGLFDIVETGEEGYLVAESIDHPENHTHKDFTAPMALLIENPDFRSLCEIAQERIQDIG